MKRQLVRGFTGALIVGAGLVLGACNKHSLVDGKFDKGVKNLYKHHGDDEHGDGHGHEAEPGDHKGHDGNKGGGHDAQPAPKEAQPESSSQPAKTLFPKN